MANSESVTNGARFIQYSDRTVVGRDDRIRILHVQRVLPGDPLISRRHVGLTFIKLFIRTDGAANGLYRATCGTDAGLENWLRDPYVWNKRVRVQVQGGFMGDGKVTADDAFSDTLCGADLAPAQVASDLGYSNR